MLSLPDALPIFGITVRHGARPDDRARTQVARLRRMGDKRAEVESHVDPASARPSGSPFRSTDSVPCSLPSFQRSPSAPGRSEEHTSELQSLMRISYAVFCLKKKTKTKHH